MSRKTKTSQTTDTSPADAYAVCATGETATRTSPWDAARTRQPATGGNAPSGDAAAALLAGAP